MKKGYWKWLTYTLAFLSAPFLILLLGTYLNWFGEYQGPGEITNSKKVAEFHISEESSPKQILFGDLHVHTSFSLDALLFNLPISGGEGVHPVADACDYARFCSSLDFFAVTDHAEWLTKREWKDSLTSIQNCAKISSDLDEPDVVPFLGWEWTQMGDKKENHYGHKNIIIKGIQEGEVPYRPIATDSHDNFVNNNALVTAAFAALDFSNRKNYFNWRFKSLVAQGYKDCKEGEQIDENSDCYLKARTPEELFSELIKLNLDTIVIPHGSAWGGTTPALSSWENQLNDKDHNAVFNRLIEVYSGHGNSEEYRDWTPIEVNPDGSQSCLQPSSIYLPTCFQAGEIIKERCRLAAGSEEECNKRAIQAREDFATIYPYGLLTIPGYDPFEWKDSGQCKDCFLPAFDFRPKMSVQYSLALTDFSTEVPIRYRYGFIGSSDNHQARPGTGYKETLRKLNTESHLDFENQSARELLNPRLTDPKLPMSVRPDPDTYLDADIPGELERATSFLYTGGLVATHSESRNREKIWESLINKEVYATSGERILLWFDLTNHQDGLKHPMGSEVQMSTSPKFSVKALGAQKQKEGCSYSLFGESNKEVIENLCRGECFNPVDERKNITRIEVVRIRPQVYEKEPIRSLIEDPWKVFECEPSQEGCSIEFIDEQFEGGNREVVYYVRAIQEPSQAINAGGLNCEKDEMGKCLKINFCGDPNGLGTGDCLSLIEERAWSSPIFVEFKPNSL